MPTDRQAIALWAVNEAEGEYWPANKVALSCCLRHGKARLRDVQMRSCWGDCIHWHANGTPLDYPGEKVRLVV